MTNASVVGLQWGDEGKGKIVDYLAGDFDAVTRFNGGSNAGHTVVIGDKKYTFHLVPSGALKGKKLLIGAGVVLDTTVLSEELNLLPSAARKNMMVDGLCTLVTPFEREFDTFLESLRGDSAIGTTRRGIGPAYAMRAFRLAPRAVDLIDNSPMKHLGDFYARLGLKSNKIAGWEKMSRDLLMNLVGNVGSELIGLCERGNSVLFEASQGTLLDLIHGSYPYVTSTHTVVSYIPAALGIPPSMAGEPIGVTKCYSTRVGGGPFPTELKGASADRLREAGKEYGATTGRPRRVGWIDLVALKYAIRINGVEKITVTKMDVLSQSREFKACIAYRLDDSETTDFREALPRLGEVSPVFESPFSMYGIKFDTGLPLQARNLIDYLEKELGVEVVLASYGEERTKTTKLS
jgi:adenylosuccinate synthase